MAPAVRQVAGGAPRRRRSRAPWVLALLVGLVVLELAVIAAVGEWIGALRTVLALVALSLLGMWMLRREGARTWRELRLATRSGQMPSTQIADAILVVVGGALLVAPGFVSDAVGLVLILPFTRPLARPVLAAAIGRRVFRDLGVIQVRTTSGFSAAGTPGTSDSGRPGRAGGQRQDGDGVIEGEIIE